MDTSAFTSCVDISQCQTSVDLSVFPKNGVKLCVNKATEGLNYIDPTYFHHQQTCVGLGLLEGGYHFANPKLDPIQQARFVCEVVGYISKTGLQITLDYEVTPTGFTSQQHCTFVDKFCTEVERLTGRKCIVYTGAFVLGDFKMPSLATRPLWLAQYTSTVKWLPKQWDKWAFWQWAGNDAPKFPGVKVAVDLDWFNGDLAALNKFIADSYLHEPVYLFESTRSVQRALQQLGYDPGAIDNLMGKNTLKAIQAFCVTIGQPVVTSVTDVLRQNLSDALAKLGAQPMNLSYFKKPTDNHIKTYKHAFAGHNIVGDGMNAGII